MMKYLRILVLSMAVVGLMAGSAFAQAALNAGNTTLAAEKISPTVDYATGAINTGYQTGGPIAATTVIKVSITNGKFTPGPGIIGIYDPVTTTVMGVGTVPAAPNNTSANVTLVSPLASGTVYQIDSPPGAGVLNGVSVPAGSPAGTIVTLSLDSVTIPGDPNVVASAPAITVKNQFSATLAPVTSKLDFADNMETFVPAWFPNPPRTSTPWESQAALRFVSDETILDKIVVADGPGACDSSLPGDTVNAKITGNLTGIGFIEYEGYGLVITTTYPVTAADRTNGFATLALPGVFDICKNNDVAPFDSALELTAADIAGTSIPTGVRTATITLVGAGAPGVVAGYSRALVAAGTTSHDIQLDATQLYIPLVGSNPPDRETYIKLQSKSTIAGSNGVKVAILASDGSVSTIYDAGSITSGTPKTITGAELVAAAAAAGKTVDGVAGFAAIVTVNAPQADVFAYANMVDAFGAKRVPCKVVGGGIVE
jgi:hypothetical protein